MLRLKKNQLPSYCVLYLILYVYQMRVADLFTLPQLPGAVFRVLWIDATTLNACIKDYN